MTRLDAIGEFEAIDRLCRRLAGRDDLRVGPGDDCAVVRPAPDADTDWLLTSDPVVEGVHFEPGTDRAAVGHKAVARALSDIAAMGGTPLWALIDVSAPPDCPIEDLEAVYDGVARTARRHGLAIAGGDLGRAERLALHVFAVGSVPAGRAVLRSGATPGDALYVTGALGGSSLGRHLAFEPRLREGAWLREGGWARAMLDVSDGLAADLKHLLDASGCGAHVELDRVPLAPALRGLPPADARRRALGEGEDFELLCAVDASRITAFEAAWRGAFKIPCTRIGTLTPEAGLRISAADGVLPPAGKDGYDHFA